MEFDGYCAMAAAYFFLSGEALGGLDPFATVADWEAAGCAARAAGLQPVQLTIRQRWPYREESSHWWIARSREGSGEIEMIDLTIGPEDEPDDYPYGEGRTRGFMQTGYRRPARAERFR